MTTNDTPPPHDDDRPSGTGGLPSYGSTPPPPGDGSYPPPPPGGGGAPLENNKKALWSMILGIVGLLCCGVFLGIPALVLGLMARKEIDATQGRQPGSGMALAGIILGAIAIVWSLAYAVLLLTGAMNFGFDTSTM